MDSRETQSAKVRLALALALGVILLAAAMWFSFSETARSLEQNFPQTTSLAIGILAALAALILLRRMPSLPAKVDPVLFFYRLCKALTLTILAVLLLVSWGFHDIIPRAWKWAGLFSAGALLAAAYIMLAYRMFRRIRGSHDMNGT